MVFQCLALYQTGIPDFRELDIADVVYLYEGIRQRLIDMHKDEAK